MIESILPRLYYCWHCEKYLPPGEIERHIALFKAERAEREEAVEDYLENDDVC